jgi:hypothetical protein
MKLHSLGTKEVSCEGEQDIVSGYILYYIKKYSSMHLSKDRLMTFFDNTLEISLLLFVLDFSQSKFFNQKGT